MKFKCTNLQNTSQRRVTPESSLVVGSLSHLDGDVPLHPPQRFHSPLRDVLEAFAGSASQKKTEQVRRGLLNGGILTTAIGALGDKTIRWARSTSTPTTPPLVSKSLSTGEMGLAGGGLLSSSSTSMAHAWPSAGGDQRIESWRSLKEHHWLMGQ